MSGGVAEAPARSYVVNREARITTQEGAEGPGWVVEAPIPGAGLRTTAVGADASPDLQRVFAALGTGGAEVALDAATAVALVDMGLLVLPEQQARPVRFAAPLAGAAGPGRAPDPSRLRVDPRARLDRAPEGDAFAPGPTIEAVDPITGVALAHWLDAGQERAVAALLAGARAPAALAPADLAALHAVGALVDRDAPGPAPGAAAPDRIATEGYVVLRSVLPPTYVAAIQRHTRALVAEGYLPLGDAQSARRYVAHDDALSAWLHPRLLAAVGPLLPGPVRPSYSYLVAYLDGADLPPHTDREQCEYTLSLALDARPDATRAGAWPLYLATGPGDEVTEVRLAPGDAVLFAGRRLAHHRHALPPGQRSTSTLLHFVAESFTGPLA